jgi:hypothetical protein
MQKRETREEKRKQKNISYVYIYNKMTDVNPNSSMITLN